MKTIICGHREGVHWNAVCEALKQAIEAGLVITEVVSGGAKGVDSMGELWARNKHIHYKIFEAEWDLFREKGNAKAAGPARNTLMAGYAEACVALCDLSRKSGTLDMVNKASKGGLWTFVFCPIRFKMMEEHNRMNVH